MWKQIYDLFIRVSTLAQRQERLEQMVEKQGQELKELTALVHRLAYQQHHASEREASEREKLLLQVENRLLREKLQLPPAPGKAARDDDPDEPE